MTKPWEENWHVDRVRGVLCGVYGEDGKLVEMRVDDDGKGRATLAAAAPDLYRALEALRAIPTMGHHGFCGVHDGRNKCGCGIERVTSQVDAALRKARGE